MLKCSDCKHAKVPGHSCTRDEHKGVEALLDTFGVMAAGFCTEFEEKDSEDDDKDSRS